VNTKTLSERDAKQTKPFKDKSNKLQIGKIRTLVWNSNDW